MSPLIYLYLDIFICICLIIIGLIVFIKNKTISLHQILFAFTIVISGWILSNFYSNYSKSDPSVILVANHLVFFFPLWSATLMLAFISSLTHQPLPTKRRNILYAVTSVLSLATLTPLVVHGVKQQGEVFAVDFGTLAPVYFFWLIGPVFYALYLLNRARKQAEERSKKQYNILYRSLSFALLYILTLNFVLPVVVGAFQLTQIGILGTIILVATLMFSMAKHQLFDIRFVVVRALGYVLSIATLVLLYSVVIFVIMQLLFSSKISVSEQILLSVSVAIAGLLFQPIRNFFDRITSSFFYRDAYDAQELYDKLNKLLVSSLDLDVLMKQTSNIIATYLRPEFCVIGLKNAGTGYRFYGDKKNQFSPEEVISVRRLAPKLRQSVIVSDYLGQDQVELHNIMRANDTAVLVRLTQNPQKVEDGQGYIVLGFRKSGNTYSERDIRTLEAVANELVLAIQNALHFEEIQQFNVGLQQKIEDATYKLRRSNEKLKALDEAKDDFVSMASHQLRTPLTSIKGYTSMVLEGDAGKINDIQRRLLEQSFTSSQRMVYLIADLLNVSRLKTGKFIIEQAPVNIAELVQQEIAQLKEAAAGRSLTLTYEQPASFPSLMLDETKTRQVIMNFVDNAIYYTPAGGHIEVKLTETPASVEFRVIDDGIGVPKSAQPHLFTKFFRAGNARTARPDGTGLGLFMAKKVIIAEGGALIFETEQGKGSTFGFVFSKTKIAPKTTQQTPVAAKKPALVKK